MGVILHVMYQHQGEGGARPVAIAGLSPHTPVLRDHVPVAPATTGAFVSKHFADLNRGENFAGGEQVQSERGQQALVVATPARPAQLDRRAIAHRLRDLGFKQHPRLLDGKPHSKRRSRCGVAGGIEAGVVDRSCQIAAGEHHVERQRRRIRRDLHGAR